MIIPLNFVIGAAAGAVTTYVVKDDSAKQWIKNAGSKIKSGASSVTGMFRKKSKEDVVVKTAAEDSTSEKDVIEGKAKDVTTKKSKTEKSKTAAE